MSNKKMLLASVLLVAAAASLLALKPSIMIVNVQAQMYEDEYYDDSYYKDDNRYGYDNRYLEKDKNPKIFPTNKVSELGDRW
jgi:hypothetical protein